MNYYPFHVGDYSSHTKHLTLMGDLAYRRLLDLYYINEKPLPLDPAECARLIGMRDQISDVSEVLSDFFLKSEAGWINKRADEEIAVYRKKADRARNAGKQRWKSDPDLKSDADKSATNNQEPITNNQKEKSIVGQKPDVAAQKSELRGKAKELLAFLNAKTGRSFEEVAVNLERIEARLKEGADFHDCKSIIAKKCGEWGADEKMAQYLRPATLFAREKFWQYHGQLEAQ